MKRVLLFSIVILLIGISCVKNDNPTTNFTSLFVNVSTYNSIAEGVSVFTVPATKIVVTDKYGKATIDSVPNGIYDVYAVDSYGSGKESVRIDGNSSLEVHVLQEQGIYPEFFPQISITEPNDQVNNSYVFLAKDTVSFVLHIGNGIPGNLVTWNSDLDGDLGTSIISDDLTSKVSFVGLTLGDHAFTVSTKGDDEYVGFLEFNVKTNGPNKLHLYELEVDHLRLKLTWSRYLGDNFSHYSIIKRSFSGVEQIYEGQIEFTQNETDTTAFIQIDNDYDTEYYVLVKTIDDFSSSESNKLFFEKNHLGVAFDRISDMVLHKYKDLVFIFNQDDFDNDKVMLYDFQNKVVIATKSISSLIKFYDIQYNGEKAILYLASDFRVYVLDGEDLSLIRTINFAKQINSVIAVSNDLIFVSLHQYNSISPIYSYSLSQSKIVDSIGYENPDMNYFLYRAPVSNKVIVFNNKNDYRELNYLDYDLNGTLNDFNVTGAVGIYEYADAPFAFSPDGSYFIPLNAESKVFKTDDNLSEAGRLSGVFNFQDITFSPNSDTIYGCTGDNWFNSYTYPGLAVIEEIKWDYHLTNVQRKGNDFYCLFFNPNNYKYYFAKFDPKK
jgi:hypothetical protein